MLFIQRKRLIASILSIAAAAPCMLAFGAESISGMNADQVAGCRYASQTTQWLAMFRDRGDSQVQAVEGFLTVARTARSPDAEMEKATREDATRRAAFVFAVPNFAPVTFGHFEFSVCKMRMLNGWLPDFAKADQITEQVVACQTQNKELKSDAMAACVDKVVLGNRK
ncbi:hypothetical protein [Massilia sp. TWP1-3-3]|uniref:hypothetical protein n=1 Tax=Massilia sp. TWP1-3-3 TaxID=2804573 RepID=UPI003CF11019